MLDQLKKLPFSEQLLPVVQHFYCGDDPWEREVADWIKDPDQVLTEMKRGCKVWIYYTDEYPVIGFGSISKSLWPWPTETSDKVRMGIIPYVAIQKQFWGKPEGPKDEYYSSQILGDLLSEARTRGYNYVRLFVHTDNQRAIGFYRRYGFRATDRTSIDQDTGATYLAMIKEFPPSNP